MKRSSSMTSLFSMSQFNCANSPYEVFSQPEPFQLPDGAQPYNPSFHEGVECSDSDPMSAESSEPEPFVRAAENNSDIIFTDTSELRSVLATLSNYKHGQLGSHLKSCRGILLLPLDAVTALRTPNSNHCLVYPTIVFYPHRELNTYIDTLPNLVEGINVLYSNT